MSSSLICTVRFVVFFCAMKMAYGGIISTVGNITLAPGGIGTVDVLVRSDGTDNLQAFGVRLQLDAPSGLLRMSNPPINTELLDAAYVFAGDSDATQNVATATISTVSTTDDTYDGADFTASHHNVPLTSSDRLLIRLQVTALSDATPGRYDLTLIDTVSTFFDADANRLPLTSIDGSITVVPEPVDFGMFGLALALIALRRIRR